jgi:hypothetical protein
VDSGLSRAEAQCENGGYSAALIRSAKSKNPLASTDARLDALAKRVLTFPDVPKTWRAPDFTEAVDPVFTVHLRRNDVQLAFFTTITTFSSPSLVTLDEIRIESSFPLDDVTRRYCEARAG